MQLTTLSHIRRSKQANQPGIAKAVAGSPRSTGSNPAVFFRLKGLVAEELLVYQCIEAAGNTGRRLSYTLPVKVTVITGLHQFTSQPPILCGIGLWTKDMKHKTNLQQTQVTKILKQLESRNLVKAIKPVNQPSKKFYMLFDLEPAREITGGAW